MLVSILLPVYNGDKFLTEALDSLSSQTLTDFEVIICDDLSNDDSGETAQEFSARDARFKYIRNCEKKGLFGNYNQCLMHAQGVYVKPFAQDDLLRPTALEHMVSVLENNKNVALVAVGRSCPQMESGKETIVQPFPETRTITAKEVIRNNLILLTNWVGEPSAVLFRRAHASTGFDTNQYHFGDLEYWFRILEHGDYFYLDEILTAFRRHNDQATTANLGGLYFAIDLLRLGEKYWPHLEEIGETKENFYRRVMEKVSKEIDHLVRNQGLDKEKVRDLVAHKHQRDDLTAKQALEAVDDFKEISFHAARLIHSLNQELYELKLVKDRWYKDLSKLELLESQLDEVHNSTSWKITAPLRILGSSLKSYRGGTHKT